MRSEVILSGDELGVSSPLPPPLVRVQPCVKLAHLLHSAVLCERFRELSEWVHGSTFGTAGER